MSATKKLLVSARLSLLSMCVIFSTCFIMNVYRHAQLAAILNEKNQPYA